MAVIDRALQDTISDVAEELTVTAGLLQRSTVHVRTQGHGAGSGVIWRPDGLIVTNAHVARTNQVGVELWDGTSFEGRVVAHDRERDLAAVKIDATGLPTLHVGDSDTLRVGQLVVAVGNPFGLSGALTFGIVQSVAPREGRGRQAWVQADVRLLPGNSGGPLADVQGNVIGINSMVAGGLGLAVPSNTVERFVGAGGGRPKLGITLQPVQIPHGPSRIAGLLILEVAAGSTAETAGLMVGDIIVGIDSQGSRESTDLLRALDALRPDTIVSLDLLRGGTQITRQVALPAQPRADWSGAAA